MTSAVNKIILLKIKNSTNIDYFSSTVVPIIISIFENFQKNKLKTRNK